MDRTIAPFLIAVDRRTLSDRLTLPITFFVILAKSYPCSGLNEIDDEKKFGNVQAIIKYKLRNTQTNKKRDRNRSH